MVVSHLRIGEKLFTPKITEGTADIVIALERLEAYREERELHDRDPDAYASSLRGDDPEEEEGNWAPRP